MHVKSLTIATALALTSILAAGSATLAAGQAKAAERQAERGGNKITDGWITMKIHSQFIPEDALDDSNVDVDTVNGVVTLSGTVATEAGRARAVAIAKGTDGVKSVNDKLRIAPDRDASAAAGAAAREGARDSKEAAKRGSRRVNDGWIKSKIYSEYLTEDALDDSDIDIDVKSGVVTLSGHVKTAAGKSRAVSIAKATEGVKDVKDALKVTK